MQLGVLVQVLLWGVTVRAFLHPDGGVQGGMHAAWGAGADAALGSDGACIFAS